MLLEKHELTDKSTELNKSRITSPVGEQMSAVQHQNVALCDLSEQTKTTLISSLASSDCKTAIKVTQTGHQRTKEDLRICFGVVSEEDFRFPLLCVFSHTGLL